jgi:hypothetical protein
MTLARLWHRHWLRLLLSAICIAMVAVVATEVTSGGRGDDARSAPEGLSPRIETAAPAGFSMPPSSAFSEVLARPVFSPIRRPGAQAGALAPSSSFTLVAIIIAPGDRHALLGFGQPAKIVRVSEGQDVGGWTVEAILPEKVVVRHADAREEVKARDGMRNAGSATPIRPAAGSPAKPPRRRAHDE